jgi:nucleoside-diphosphate-sugar epimerase
VQKAFVTGASGFIGSALTRRLLGEGIAVRALCRTTAKAQALAEANSNVEIINGDIQDALLLRRSIDGCDVVFHVAAAMNGNTALQHRINVEGTLNVMRAAHEAGAHRFVLVSSVAVYGYDVDGRIDESCPHRPSRYDGYMLTKSLGEKAAWDFARESGLPTVSVRPAFVYGPGSQLWSKALYDLCRRFRAVLIDGGRGHAHPIFVEDVVDLLLTAATHLNAPGHAFNAAPDPPPTWREFLGHYGRIAGNTATLNVPLRIVRILKPLFAALTRCLGFAGIPVDIGGPMEYLSRRATYSMDCAASVIGWQPRFSLAEGMARTESWLTGTRVS